MSEQETRGSMGTANPTPDSNRATLAACCLLKLRRPAEAEAVLATLDGSRPGFASYYLGLALAAQGRRADALVVLRNACRDAASAPPARAALTALLKSTARQMLGRGAWVEACQALSEVATMDPTDAELGQMASTLGSGVPAVYLAAGRRQDAAEAWERQQRAQAQDFTATHSLALLYFFWAEDLEARAEAQAASNAWEGAIRNWVALAYANGFWQDLSERRKPIVGQVSPPELGRLPRRLLDLLARRLREHENGHRACGRAADVRRLSDLSLKLSAETRTADALKRVLQSLTRQVRLVDTPPLCGVLMLRHLGELESAQRLLALVEVTQTNERSTQDLHWCLSPWVFPWIMVEERRYDEAIECLGERLERASSSEDGHNLAALAYEGRGRQAALAGDFDAALDSWAEALTHVRNGKIRKQIRCQLENTIVTEATRLQSQGGKDAIEKGIELIGVARRIADTKRLTDSLAEFHTTLGVIKGNDNTQNAAVRRKGAREHLETALKLCPEHGRAKKNLAAVLGDQGIADFKLGHHREALGALRRAHQLDPADNDLRGVLSRVMSNCGVQRWNAGARTEGDALLREALEIDPTNDHAINNLDPSQLGAVDVDALLGALRRR